MASCKFHGTVISHAEHLLRKNKKTCIYNVKKKTYTYIKMCVYIYEATSIPFQLFDFTFIYSKSVSVTFQIHCAVLIVMQIGIFQFHYTDPVLRGVHKRPVVNSVASHSN